MNNQEKQKRLKEKEQIAFMDEVDAALHRRPRIGARGLSLGTAVAVILFLIWRTTARSTKSAGGRDRSFPPSTPKSSKTWKAASCRKCWCMKGRSWTRARRWPG